MLMASTQPLSMEKAFHSYEVQTGQKGHLYPSIFYFIYIIYI